MGDEQVDGPGSEINLLQIIDFEQGFFGQVHGDQNPVSGNTNF